MPRQPPSPDNRRGPDGINRPPATEDHLNRIFAAWLTGPLAAECLAHLRQITIETAAGPHVSNDELRHREGQRFLVAYMTQRKALFEKAQRHADTARQLAAAGGIDHSRVDHIFGDDSTNGRDAADPGAR